MSFPLTYIVILPFVKLPYLHLSTQECTDLRVFCYQLLHRSRVSAPSYNTRMSKHSRPTPSPKHASRKAHPLGLTPQSRESQCIVLTRYKHANASSSTIPTRESLNYACAPSPNTRTTKRYMRIRASSSAQIAAVRVGGFEFTVG